MQREPQIYCSHCKWQPKAEDRWFCMPSCNASWNTFWTGGVCPKCLYRWLKTQCLSCGEISLHEDWYHYPDGDNVSEREQSDTPTTVEP
jgi:hypothetical protein